MFTEGLVLGRLVSIAAISSNDNAVWMLLGFKPVMALIELALL